MTRIVAEMITLLSGVDTDASDYLESKDRGLQLAGFAYLYANPDSGRSQELVLALTQEDQEPFSQYWGLRSLRKQLAVDPSSLDFNSRRELESLQERLDPRSDRGYELREALREAEAKTPS